MYLDNFIIHIPNFQYRKFQNCFFHADIPRIFSMMPISVLNINYVMIATLNHDIKADFFHFYVLIFSILCVILL